MTGSHERCSELQINNYSKVRQGFLNVYCCVQGTSLQQFFV